ncbi:MAG TPA: hypothetical protein VLA46_06990 [Saprospiraceae bacterium]|nr:hypothetical protein [Saprospiraceae bacterium]
MMDYVVIPGVRLYLAMASMLVSSLLCAEQPADQAAAFFKQKEYDKALTIWYGMVHSGQSSAGIFYNIGLAESQLHNTPKALLAYEQALRLRPMDEVVQTAITEERKKIQDATIPVEPFFLNQWYKALVTFLRPGYWSFLGLSLIGIAVLRWLRPFKRNKTEEGHGHRFKIPLAILGACFVLTGWLSYKEIYRENEAILVAACEIRQAPADDSPETRTLYPGEKMMMTDSIGEWYHVQLLNLDAGWLKKNCLMPIIIEHR